MPRETADPEWIQRDTERDAALETFLAIHARAERRALCALAVSLLSFTVALWAVLS